MTDAQYLQAFVEGGIAVDDFSHAMHIRVARQLLIEVGSDQALVAIRAGLRLILAKADLPDGRGYHETLTVAWLRVVHSAILREPGGDFQAFAAVHPEVLNSSLVFDYYDRSIVDDPDARKNFVPPGGVPLPWNRTA